jgi:hypothetical protein
VGGGTTAITGRVEFIEGTSAKWIFDVEIEKFRADIFVYMSRRPKSCLVLRKKS